MQRRTKIIATIGPATLDFSVFKLLIEEGVDIIRLNTSYGDFSQYEQILSNVRKIEARNLKILYDIKKEESISFFIKNKLDILAVSFAETSLQIENYRKLAPDAFIVSKIETKRGVENIDLLLSASDGIMIARGDLSEAETLEKIPSLEKYLAQKTKNANKYLITATEMMLSIVDKPKPEIAEVSDVANAVFEGADAVMLSEETAIGNHPVEAVHFMRRTIEEAEQWLKNKAA